MAEHLKNLEDSKTDGSLIAKMFAGATVFLTGGTGFLGKLLLEKLLRSCPDIKRIYFLIRSKKGKDVNQRMQEQFQDVLYDRLRKDYPDFIKKLSPVKGDAGQLNLGISEEDRNTIVNEVDFIFHGAATVRFDEALRTAVDINVRGTREMMTLARACTKLRALVHVSTAYSNCPLKEIDEKFYNIAMSGEKLIDLVESVDEKTLTAITPGLLGDYPNTYSYSKAAAENIVQKYSRGLPVAIVRPSIVISTAEGPVPGWIDNVYGPTGALLGAGIGVLHTFKGNPEVVSDLVPGDYVVNSCIAVAWKTAKDYPGAAAPEDEPAIFNFVLAKERPLTWGTFMINVKEYGLKTPTIEAIWMCFVIMTPSEVAYRLWFFLFHWIPAYIVDGVAVMIGKKPILKRVYAKIDKGVRAVSYFACREWMFHDNNTRKLLRELCPADQRTFHFDMASFSWEEYFKTYVKGVRIYLLRDPFDTIPGARRKQFLLKILHYFCIALISLGLMKLLLAFIRLVNG